jgi:hypothetical protein
MRYRLRTLLILLAIASITAPWLLDTGRSRIVLPTKGELLAKESVQRRALAGERHGRLMKRRQSGKAIER